MRIIRSEAVTNRALADTARAPRLAPIDPATIGRTRAAIRRHRAKRRALAALATLSALATIGSLVAMVAM